MLKKVHELIQELEQRSTSIAAMKMTAKVPDSDLVGNLLNLANDHRDLDRLSRVLDRLMSKATLSQADAEQSLRQVISERHFYGSYCELMAYEWFDRHDVKFTMQVPLTGQDVLNPNGCIIDGRFDEVDAYFDIKSFGFQAYVMELFRQQLKKLLPGFDVVIDGPSDIAVKDIETYAFGQLNAHRASLANGGITMINELGWTIRAHPPRRVTSAVHTHEPYRLAEENRYYPFKTAGQFTRQKPFVIVFPYSAKFNSWLAGNFLGSTDLTLRAMARRAFFQLTADLSPIQNYDNQASSGATVADAAKLLSAMLFLNLDNDEGWLFLNPRATHLLRRDNVEQIFDFKVPVNLGIDDFAYDDY